MREIRNLAFHDSLCPAKLARCDCDICDPYCACDILAKARAEGAADERDKAKAEVNAILDRGLTELRGANEFVSPLSAALNIRERTLGRLDRWAARGENDTGNRNGKIQEIATEGTVSSE